MSRQRFLHELKRFGFELEANLLQFFLQRFNIDLSLTNDEIPYRDVLNAFKQKSDRTKKRINADNQMFASPKNFSRGKAFFFRVRQETRQSSLERQIDFVLMMNFERVRNLFSRLDKSHRGTISSNQLRAIIEDLLHYILKPDEFYRLMKKVPIDEHGQIQYKKYLKEVHHRTLTFQQEKSLK